MAAAVATIHAAAAANLRTQRCQFRIAPPQRRAVNRTTQVPRLLYVLVATDKKQVMPSDFSHRDKYMRRNNEDRQDQRCKKQQRLEGKEQQARTNARKNNNNNIPGDGGNRVWVKMLVFDDTTLREILEEALMDEYARKLLLLADLASSTAGGGGGGGSSGFHMVELFHVFPCGDDKPKMETLGQLSLTTPSATKVDLMSIGELGDPKTSEFRAGDMITICGAAKTV